MQEPVASDAMLWVMAASAVLSLAAGFFLFQRHIAGLPLLPYEPRRRVPWGPLLLMVPLFFIGINLLPIPSGDETAVEHQTDVKDFVVGGLTTSFFLISFVVIVVAWLLAEKKADARDLGLPQDMRQFWLDVGHGCFACVAALLPIYMINFALVTFFQSPVQHPLIEQLLKDHSPQVMLVSILTAVIAAPLFEEFTFRVLLQGWLERLEDERLGYAGTLRRPLELAHENSDANGELLAAESATRFAESPRPARGWLPSVPHGWTPILISSFAFGLAHLGHGFDPVPLMFLGLVLGYLYQRTHRLAPSIAAHALFNGYTLLLLWLQMEQG